MSKLAQERYDNKNTKQFKMKLNTKTDADIIEYLDTLDNKQGKVKELIREEIARHKTFAKQKEVAENKAKELGYEIIEKGKLEDATTIITDTPDALTERLIDSYNQAEKEYLRKETARMLEGTKKLRESMKAKRSKGN